MTGGTLRSGIPDSRCTSQWGCPWDNGSPQGGYEDRRGEELGLLEFVDGYHQLMQERYLFLYCINCICSIIAGVLHTFQVVSRIFSAMTSSKLKMIHTLRCIQLLRPWFLERRNGGFFGGFFISLPSRDLNQRLSGKVFAPELDV